jgi:hypothetical protein
MPSASSSSRAATAICTSDPVPDEHDLRGAAAGVRQDVPAAATPSASPTTSRSNTGHVLPGQADARPGRSVCSSTVRQATAVSLASAGRTTSRPGTAAQRGEVLDPAGGRAVLAEADRVVRPDVGDRQAHQRGEPDGPAHVVAEDQEGAAEDAGAAVQRDARS